MKEVKIIKVMLNKNLKLSAVVNLNSNKIEILALNRTYEINGKYENFEIRFMANFKNKLSSEHHIINNKPVAIYKCDTSISPTLEQIYKSFTKNIR